MNINQFLNKNKGAQGEKASFKEGVATAGVKAGRSIWEATKYVTPANVKMVENLHEEVKLDRAHAIGNFELLFDRVNQISEAIGYDVVLEAMSDEEVIAFAKAAEIAKKEAEKAAKAAKKEEKKAAKVESKEGEDEPKNSKLKAFLENFTVSKKDPNPVESAVQGDSPYPDEDETATALRQLEEKLLRQEAPIIIEAEAVEVEEVKEPTPRRGRNKKKAKEEVVEATPRKKVAVFDQPDDKYNFEDMA